MFVEQLCGREYDLMCKTDLDPQGTVTIEGERWRATTEGDRIEVGEEVTVTRVDKVRLTVTRKSG